MTVNVKCYNVNPRRVSLEFDGVPVKFRCKDNIIIADMDTQIGTHCLTIRKLSLYDRKYCYLNIVNPVFWVYQFKLMNRHEYLYDEDFLLCKVDFKVLNTKDSVINLELSRKESYDEHSYMIECNVLKSEDIKNIRLSCLSMPREIINRFKITNGICQLFWGILLGILIAIYAFFAQNNVATYVIVALILTCYCIVKAFKFFNAKSVNEIENTNN